MRIGIGTFGSLHKYSKGRPSRAIPKPDRSCVPSGRPCIGMEGTGAFLLSDERVRMSTLLVTGGCGFIGSNFVRYILETDPDVTVVNFDASPTPATWPTSPTSPTIRATASSRATSPTATPCAPPSSWASATSSTSRPKATSTAASRTPGRSSAPTCSARRSCSTPPASSASNASCRCPPTRSTAASARPACSPRTTPLAPNSPYAASKAAADLLVRSYVHTFGCRRSSRAARTTTGRTSSPRS